LRATPDQDFIEGYPKIGAVLIGTPPSKPAASAWWAQPGAILRIAPASTRPYGDLKHPMHKPPGEILFEI
jgi:hypothetical protein